MELHTRLIGKELTMVSVEILILSLEPEIKLKHYQFSRISPISLPGAGFLAFSIYLNAKHKLNSTIFNLLFNSLEYNTEFH